MALNRHLFQYNGRQQAISLLKKEGLNKKSCVILTLKIPDVICTWHINKTAYVNYFYNFNLFFYINIIELYFFVPIHFVFAHKFTK